jgi:hypothetical protein
MNIFLTRDDVNTTVQMSLGYFRAIDVVEYGSRQFFEPDIIDCSWR